MQSQSTLSWILSNVRKTWSQNRQMCVLISLGIRAMSAWFERAAEHLLDIETLIKKIDTISTESLSRIWWIQALWSDTFDPSIAYEVYENIRRASQPYLPWLLGLLILSSLISTLLYMVVSYTIFDQHDDTDSTWGKKLLQWISQLIPYRLTLLFQWIIILLWFWIFFLPWIILLIYFSFTQSTILKEKTYWRTAMKRSYSLVKWRRWKTLWNIILIIILLWIFAIFIIWLTEFIISHIQSDIIWKAIIWIISTFVWVTWWIALTHFYLIWKQTEKIIAWDSRIDDSSE